MTPREFEQAYKGYMWGRERLLKDLGWILATLSNTCGQPTKSKKKYRTEDFVKVGTNKKYKENLYYLQLMNIRG